MMHDGFWLRIGSTQGGNPCPRKGHSSILYSMDQAIASPNNSFTTRKKMIIFGGFSEKCEFLNDCFQFDLESKKWTEVKCWGNIPTARYGHSASLVKGSLMLIWAGFLDPYNKSTKDKDKSTHGQQLYALNLESHEWNCLECGGHFPEITDGHSTVEYEINKKTFLVVFGGRNSSWKSNNQVHLFDTDKHQWVLLECTGNAPCPRVDHVSQIIDQHLIVFGGYDDSNYISIIDLTLTGGQFLGRKNDCYILNLESRIWQELRCDGNIPFEVSNHKSVLFRENSNQPYKLLFFGGWDHHKLDHNETYSLELPDLQNSNSEVAHWKKLVCSGTLPLQRRSHSAVLNGNKMLVFAGYGAGGNFFNDMFELEITVAKDFNQTLQDINNNNSCQLWTGIIPNLDETILRKIFTFGSGFDLQNWELVCKKWKDTIQRDGFLWRDATDSLWKSKNLYRPDNPSHTIKSYFLHPLLQKDGFCDVIHSNGSMEWKKRFLQVSKLIFYCDITSEYDVAFSDITGCYQLFYIGNPLFKKLSQLFPRKLFFVGIFSTKFSEYSLIKGVVAIETSSSHGSVYFSPCHIFAPNFQILTGEEDFFQNLIGSRISNLEEATEMSAAVTELIALTLPNATVGSATSVTRDYQYVIECPLLIIETGFLSLTFTFSTNSQGKGCLVQSRIKYSGKK